MGGWHRRYNEPSVPIAGDQSESDGPSSKPATPGAPVSPEATPRRLNVLIVDDMTETRELFCFYFETQGARVRMAQDGVAALRAVLAERPDVIVLDLAMPRMTGWEVIGLLRQDESTQGIPIVTLSGQGARESALEAGPDSYLENPCLPADVWAEVLRVVDRGPNAPAR